MSGKQRVEVHSFVLKLNNNKRTIAFVNRFLLPSVREYWWYPPRSSQQRAVCNVNLVGYLPITGFTPRPMVTGWSSSNGSFIFCYQVYHIKIIITFLKSQTRNALQGEIDTNCLFIFLNFRGSRRKGVLAMRQ